MTKQFLPIFAPVPCCPGCGVGLNAIAGNAWPKAGDYNVCFYCHAVLRFLNDKFACRFALPEEVERDIASGELTEKDAELLRMCFAERAKKKGVSS